MDIEIWSIGNLLFLFEHITDLPASHLEYVAYDCGGKLIFMKLERLEQPGAQTYQFKQLDSNLCLNIFWNL